MKGKTHTAVQGGVGHARVDGRMSALGRRRRGGDGRGN